MFRADNPAAFEVAGLPAGTTLGVAPAGTGSAGAAGVLGGVAGDTPGGAKMSPAGLLVGCGIWIGVGSLGGGTVGLPEGINPAMPPKGMGSGVAAGVLGGVAGPTLPTGD